MVLAAWSQVSEEGVLQELSAEQRLNHLIRWSHLKSVLQVEVLDHVHQVVPARIGVLKAGFDAVAYFETQFEVYFVESVQFFQHLILLVLEPRPISSAATFRQ